MNDLSSRIRTTVAKACQFLRSGSQLVSVPAIPDHAAQPNNCFNNVDRKVEQCGGAVQFGWLFSATEFIVVASHHAVWRSTDQRLIDIIPAHDSRDIECGVARALQYEDGHRAFLPDDSATVVHGFPRPCRAFALSNNREIKRWVRKHNAREWEYWTAVLGGDLDEAKEKLKHLFAMVELARLAQEE